MASLEPDPLVAFEAIPTSNPQSAGRGIGRLVQGVLDGLNSLQERPGILRYRYQGDPEPSPGFEGARALKRKYWVGAAPWVKHLLMEREVRREWLRSGCPIWQGCEPYLFPAPGAGQRSVLMMYDIIPLLLADQYVNRYKRGNQWFWKHRLPDRWRRASAVIVNSREVKRTAMEHLGIPGDRLHVVPLGVDLTLAHIAPSPVQGDFFLYVGACEFRKNLPFLIRSFARFRQGRVDDFRLVVAGGMGPDSHRELSEAAGAAGVGDRVVLTGRVSDEALVALYKSARGFLFPSLVEGFGLPPLEAMLQGCPVLSSDSSCMPEVLGDCALFADPVDESGFCAGMRRLADEPELVGRLVDNGRRRASEFTWDRTARAIVDVWRSVDQGAVLARGG